MWRGTAAAPLSPAAPAPGRPYAPPPVFGGGGGVIIVEVWGGGPLQVEEGRQTN